MDLKNIDRKYKPLPFWSWNDKLEKKETKRQVDIMGESGMGGFFMHARSGLLTEYMGEEWFSNVKVSIDEAKKYGMEAWAYDENGYPSGFGDGIVNGLGEKYQQKVLKYEKTENSSGEGTTICEKDGYRFYYILEPFYVDLLDSDVTAEFIKNIYEPYYEKFGNDIVGFFTDEPNVGTQKNVWSLVIPCEYKKRYGEDILEKLIEIFEDVGGYKDTRKKFRKLVTDLFSENYFKKIYDWCDKRGLKLTGHILLEENLAFQIDASGASMPHYEYFHIPGVDQLSRNSAKCSLGKQVSSVASQLGKKQILTESFACGGYELNFSDMRRILESQMVRGVNRYCAHLEGYSLRGSRKRDNPPAVYYQQPWWDEYEKFSDAMSRIGYLLSEGEEVCDTLLIHPLTKAWTMYNGTSKSVQEIDDMFENALETLEKKHIMFHLGDETIIERHGKIENNKFIIGKMKYDKVIVLYDELFENTKNLLMEYKNNGGIILSIDEISENNVVDNENITYTMRKFDDCAIHYFVNLTGETQKCKFNVGSEILDIETGEWSEFYGEYIAAPYTSIILKDNGERHLLKQKFLKQLSLSGEWKIINKTMNLYTLDFCKYYIDGELQEEKGYILNVLYRAMKLNRPCKIDMEFTFNAKYVPKEMYMLLEDAAKFKITINDSEVIYKDCGFYIDSSFRKVDISKYVKSGENNIFLSCIFSQSDKVYKDFYDSFNHTTVCNKLSYEMEIESIYLMGDFGVFTDGEIIPINKKAYKINGNFYIDKPKAEITLSEIEKQGFMFYSGKITVEKEITLTDNDYALKFSNEGVNSVLVNVNGEDVKALIFEPYEVELSKYIKKGKNKIQLTLTNNLRNLLGPHHFKWVEEGYIAPPNFYKEPCVYNDKTEADFDNCYYFVKFGLNGGE